jgi:SNF2 family DNA or RNA helicase
MKYAPHNYQKEAIKFLMGQACGGLFLDPGLGKTSIVLKAFQILKSQGYAGKMLVVAPLRPAYSVWPREAQKWDEFRSLTVDVLHGPDKLEKLRAGADVQVINPEGLKWLFSQKVDPWWDILVVDESTRFKHSNTQRFRLLRPFIPKFRRRYILTGSPAPNGLLDLFGQIYILDMGNALGRFITHYRLAYFDATGFGGYTYQPRRGAEARIYEKLRPLVLRMSAEDYLELPPLIENVVEVELPEEAREVYQQMESILLADIKADERVVAANAAVATMKCRQIANGGIFHNDRETWTHLHDAKTEAVSELVEELSGKPALVAYEFAHDRERLNRAFPDAPYLGGGVTPRRQREIEDAWNAGKIPVLLAQPQSVAHGLNLQGTGAAIISHSLTWNLEDDEQFIRRVWRQGQQERVFVHRIVARKTIDEVVMKMIAKKDRVQQNLLAALKDYFKCSTS